ncbi:unnamed protein product [Chilo suppressalis]|uniref:Arylphorin subunit alpha n=1 Tax=Chilo suppressalis TaxID=168631 RepID=A0ABN8B203_CHISP|nr:unnamed protein product [Chilo suppressalis]
MNSSVIFGIIDDKMKVLTSIFVISLIWGHSSSYLIKVPTKPIQAKTASVDWVHIQKRMIPLFENVCEQSTNEIVVRLAEEFKNEPTTDAYTKADVVDNLRNINTNKGLLPKGEIFSEYNITHMNELKVIYEIFYYAKDFDTFYKAACWARQNINCGLFVDAIYLAVLTRRDTSKISLPPPYEVLPNYFIQRDVIVKASYLLSGEDVTNIEDIRVENNAYILAANYTSNVNDDNEDFELSYFREDIGLNSFYFLRKLINAAWFNIPSEIGNNYGDYMFLLMKQFAARYDLERYSNGLQELESLNLNSVADTYNPMLIYSNGNDFDHRSIPMSLEDTDDATFLKTIENNLATVVGHLRQAGYNKSQILNHLIEILVTSDKSYENIARRLWRNDIQVNERLGSCLSHYLTSLRDPIFWKINKKLVELIDNALEILPSYSRKELYFPGVEVSNIETKKMITSFESYQIDVTNSLNTIHGNTTFQVKIAQNRLNHKPFVLKLNISSLTTQMGVAKIYLGPKIMPGEFASKKNAFVLMDRFELNLKRGINVISRSSEEMKTFSGDFLSLGSIIKKVEDAEFGLDALPLQDVEWQIGYPSRLVLPKGLPEGLPLQIFVFIAPFTKNSLSGSSLNSNVNSNTASLSAGYPLDLFIEEKELFNLPNALMKDIIITHKDGAKASGYDGKSSSKNWNPNNSFDSAGFDYVNKNENSYRDYNNKDGKENINNLLDETPNLLDRTTVHTKQNKTYSKYADEIQKMVNENHLSKVGGNIKGNLEIKDDIQTKHLDKQREYIRSFDKIHNLLGERPAFTYKNRSGDDNTVNLNRFRNKGNFSSRQAGFRKYDISKDSLVNTENFNADIDNKNNNINLIEKQHGLLGGQPKFYYDREDSNNIDTKDDVIKTDRKTKFNKPMQNKVIVELPTNRITGILSESYEKTHPILGARSDFSYKKDTTDYTSKRNQYKEKSKKYGTKQSEDKNEEYSYTVFNRTNKEENPHSQIIENEEDNIEQNEYETSRKYIVNKKDKNNIVYKNVYTKKTTNKGDNLEKNDEILNKIGDSLTTERYTTLVKEIIKDPSYIDTYDLKAHDMNYMEDLGFITLNGTIPETPGKRASVYNYLFNNIPEDEIVYQ